MQTRTCPDCGDDIYVNAKSHKCGWRLISEKVTAPRQHRMEPEAKAAYEAAGPTSHTLTDQQWYNVCRFWPTIARRCSRPFADVGPHNRLHATSTMGPLLTAMKAKSVAGIDPQGEDERRAIEAAFERSAIQAEGEACAR